MNENEMLAKTTCTQLQSGLPVVLISIISFQGSTPRHSGSKMLVGSDGQTYGTIGGGLTEAVAINRAKKALASPQSGIMCFDLTGKDAADLGMICGGKMEVLLDHIAPTPDNLEFARRWYTAASLSRQFYIFTHLNREQTQVLGHAIWAPDSEEFLGTSLTRDHLELLKPELHNVSITAVVSLNDDRVIVERIRKTNTLFCFGAGHVAVPTARLAAMVGFRVVVLDDRSDFANANRFPDADRIIVLDDFNNALNGLHIDEESFIVIITRGHQYDRTVLEQSLQTGAGYIGMISSRKKRDAIYDALRETGIRQDVLGAVHSPIGLDIGGETPEEIAVSIVAELIMIRSQES